MTLTPDLATTVRDQQAELDRLRAELAQWRKRFDAAQKRDVTS